MTLFFSFSFLSQTKSESELDKYKEKWLKAKQEVTGRDEHIGQLEATIAENESLNIRRDDEFIEIKKIFTIFGLLFAFQFLSFHIALSSLSSLFCIFSVLPLFFSSPPVLLPPCLFFFLVIFAPLLSFPGICLLDVLLWSSSAWILRNFK